MAQDTARGTRIKINLIDSVARVDLRVRDIRSAVDFYTDVVGLEKVEVSEDRATLNSPGGPAVLELDSAGLAMTWSKNAD